MMFPSTYAVDMVLSLGLDWTKIPYASAAALLSALDRLVRELQIGTGVKVGRLGPGPQCKNGFRNKSSVRSKE